MSEERCVCVCLCVCVFVCVCVCVCVSKIGVSFWPCGAADTERDGFVSPDKRSAFTWAGLANYTFHTPPTETKGERSGMSDWDQAGSLFISGGGVRSVFGS